MTAKKRTIRDIKIQKKPAKHYGRRKQPHEPESSSSVKKSSPLASRRSRKKTSGGGRGLLWGLALLVVAAVIIFVMTKFARAHIVIVPERDSAEVDVTLRAFRNAGNDDLRFSTVALSDEVREVITATDEAEVELKASGTIVIYNEEPSSQRFVEETRFETPDGLIFKLPKGDSITVPAAKGDTPGQLEVVVYADEPGESYNIEKTDFVIPGWREINNSKFDTQFARAKTDMVGGFIGIERSVNEDESALLRASLKSSLEDRLQQSGISQIPEEFVLLEGASKIIPGQPSQENVDGNKVELIESGSFAGVIFDRVELGSYVAGRVLDDYDGSPVVITNIEALVSQMNLDDFDPESTKEITFSLSGTAEFEWVIDHELLKEKLRGEGKRQFPSLLKE
jgi:hypothetical protein